ncbi:MAG: hypothetical protein PHO00_03950 [bacterium]|nr:hypothetical protein [bacterium]
MLKKAGLVMLVAIFVMSCTSTFSMQRTTGKIATPRVEDETLDLKIARNQAREDFNAANKALSNAKVAYNKARLCDRPKEETEQKYQSYLKAKTVKDNAQVKLDAAVAAYANALKAAKGE